MNVGQQPTSPMGVLIPNELGMKYVAEHPNLIGIPYKPDEPPTDAQRTAPVIVVDMTPAAEIRRFIDQLDGVRVIQALSAGVEHWDGNVPDGVALANASGAHGAGVAEWVVAMLLSHYRQLPEFFANQAAQRWQWRSSGTLLGKNVGVIGAGDLGQSTRHLLEAFGCSVTMYARTPRAGVRAITDFADESPRYDIIVLALPDTPQTRHLADAAFLRRLRDGAVIVNIGRGPTIDTAALIAAAGSGKITAMLDVTDPEPLPAGHPLWSTPGILLTPHVAGSIPDVWDRAWHTVLSNLDDWISTGKLRNVVSMNALPELSGE